MKYHLYFILLCITHNTYTTISISRTQAEQIGKKIWKNECLGTIEGLTHWVQGEQCASLGIGHFIWYPRNVKETYTQTFPALLSYFKRHGVALPAWLKKNIQYCPWNSRTDFLAAQNSIQMKELRTLLAHHIDLQTQFIIERLTKALPNMLNHVPKNRQTHIKKQFYRVAQSKNGLYALIDYINFKGEGINPQERYKGKGWGLLQILQQMHGSAIGPSATHEFSQTAARVLRQRIMNAPANTVDKQFLRGWLNRVQTYAKLNLL